jgi:anti-anti-sigma factor
MDNRVRSTLGLLRLKVRRPIAGVVVVNVAGEIDVSTAPLLWTVVRRQIATRPRVFVLDLSRVRFLGACGVAVLMTAQKMAPRLGVTLRLARPSQPVARPLTVLRLDGAFTMCRSLAGAITDPT